MPAEARAVAGSTPSAKADGMDVYRLDLTDGTELVAVVSGVGRDRAAEAARWLLEQGARALVSVGIAGGLAPELRPGDIVVGDSVVDEPGTATEGGGPGRFDTNPLLTEPARQALVDNGLEAVRGTVVTVARAELGAEGKSRLYRGHGAVAVDMESSAVARAAAGAGVPFFVLRSVCDTADRYISPHLADTLDENGRPRPLVLAARLIRRPWLVGHLFMLKREFDAAIASLGRAFEELVVLGLPATLASAPHQKGKEDSARAATSS